MTKKSSKNPSRQYVAEAVYIEGDVEDITKEQLEAWLDALAECLAYEDERPDAARSSHKPPSHKPPSPPPKVELRIHTSQALYATVRKEATRRGVSLGRFVSEALKLYVRVGALGAENAQKR